MFRSLFTAILITVTFCAYAQDQLSSAESILIRNVTVMDQAGISEDRVVSILIRQKKLTLVTRDKIKLKAADKAPVLVPI